MSEQSAGVRVTSVVKASDLELPFDLFSKRFLEPVFNQMQSQLERYGPSGDARDNWEYSILMEAVEREAVK